MEIMEVLIADDSNLILKIIKKALLENKIADYHFEEEKIHFAKNGIEAFEMMGKNKNISMLISDINMPFLNGDDLVEVLIDTELHHKITTIFITSNESTIKESSKKHTIGTIRKPFNYITFNEYLNELLWKHHEDKTFRAQQQSEQINYMMKALKVLCDKHHALESQIKESALEDILNIYFNDKQQAVEEEEVEFIFYSFIDELFKVSNIALKLTQQDLKFALHYASQKNHEYNIALKETITSSIENCQELLREKKESKYQLIVNELTSPMSEKLFMIQNKVMHFKPKRYATINPYMEEILHFFEQMDYALKDEYLCELLAYKKAIEEFSLWINAYCKENKLAQDIPQIKNLTHLLKEIYDKYTSASISLNKMQNYIIGEIEMYIFYKALTSKVISTYLKKNMENVIPNTCNILLHMDKIDQHEHKKLAENDYHTLIVLSHDIDFLRFFKEEYQKDCIHTKIFCFSVVSLLENWIKNNRADKLIIDYDFSSNVFDSGVVYLKYFLKKGSKNKALSPLIKYNRYYIVASRDILAREKENLHKINAHLIEKPLNKNAVQNILVYS